ncbi:MAG: hypothetical protein KBC36_09010 [Spirochaetia bacterium]|nr:hypothetical protein [Spirochaetia bacterium]
MKRFIALSLILALVAGGAFAQTTIDDFKAVFTDFTDSFASTLMLNSTIGNDWSDGYVGGFPHFGVGLVLGSTFTGEGTADPVFNLMGVAVPQELEQLGVPIPAVALVAKLGLPFLPIDIGVKAGVVTPEMATALEGAYGVAAAYKNVGASIRGRVLKEGVLLPELSLGVAGNYLTGDISSAIPGVTGQDVTYEPGDGSIWTVSLPAPKVAYAWETKTLDFTAQVSKNILFIRPYLGAGYTIGTSTVAGGLASDTPTASEGTTTVYDYDGDGDLDGQEDLDDLIYLAETSGASGVPDFSATGFLYSPLPVTDPGFRVYAGVSVSILVTLDLQLMYVPATEALGASISARLQL